jgi:hypothetical protein
MARSIVTAALLMLAAASPLRAQEKGQVGIAVAYPQEAGLVWHVAERIALRPDVSFRWSSNELTNGPLLPSSSTQSSNDAWNYLIGVSALVYVKKWDALSAYLVPRFAYGRGRATSTLTSSINVGSPETRSETTDYEASGSFGAQYALHHRFSVFSELGLAYTRSKTSTVPASLIGGATSDNLAPKAGVGIVFYF